VRNCSLLFDDDRSSGFDGGLTADAVGLPSKWLLFEAISCKTGIADMVSR
jgi:hypothetical protein